MIKAILFDFNGVIVDDEPYHHKAFTEALKNVDISISDEDYFGLLGTNDVTFVQMISESKQKNLSENEIQTIIDEKRKIYWKLIDEKLPIFDGAVNLIKSASYKFELGIVSMARRDEIEGILERVGIRNLFSTIVSTDEVSICKPDPTCYNLGFSQIDKIRTKKGKNPMTRNECLVIEDSPPGVSAGKAAGLNVLGVTNTVSANDLRNAGADCVTKTLVDWTTDAVIRVF